LQTGAVLTFQDSSAIQRVDRSLRSRNRPRHFVAKYRLSQLQGDSPAIRMTRGLAERYAKSEATVLIMGESGTGKELLAQGIHNASRRRDRPFVAINCGAFPESLLEGELFGYEEGAFTGTRRGGKTGLFELAHTGTIFLDEIGDMLVALQTRLLRVLQEKEVLRLGSVDSTPIDVRVIAATNRDLRDQVELGEFRSDLYYRLNILPIEVPPLRERRDDIASIAAYLFDSALRRLGCKRASRDLLDLVLPHFQRYDWPGNVREMENIVERMTLFYSDLEDGDTPDMEQLARVVPEIFNATSPSALALANDVGALRSAARNAELARILKTIEECNGNQAEACRRLGIGRTTLWRRLRLLDPAAIKRA
jgi:transcriptional regulator, propionate catabolism operon regulatory protein